MTVESSAFSLKLLLSSPYSLAKHMAYSCDVILFYSPCNSEGKVPSLAKEIAAVVYSGQLANQPRSQDSSLLYKRCPYPHPGLLMI